jgi:hypothetical protein
MTTSSRTYHAVITLLDTYGRPYRTTVATPDPKFPGFLNIDGKLTLHPFFSRRIRGYRK